MNELLEKVLTQSPMLGVALVLVWMFLRAMDKRDALLKQLHNEHIEERREGRAVVRDCTASNRELVACINDWKEQKT